MILLHARFQRIVFAWLAFLFAAGVQATTYYVSNQGSDENAGDSPQAAWATLGRVNAATLKPGDVVLFRRGDVWRGSLLPRSGDASAPVLYSAYGEGPKPLLLGSVAKSAEADWTEETVGVWSAGVFSADVGNIILGEEKSCGVKVWSKDDLENPGDYWYDPASRTVKFRSDENPAKCYGRIECAIRDHIISQSNGSYITYENLALKYGAAHGIGGGNTHHIVVRDCDFGYIGGGDQHGGGQRVRFGNGVEFWAEAHDNLVERCRLWEIYDAALTNQSNGPRTPQYNITYRNNVIWNSEYSFEYWNRPDVSESRDIVFENNTCVNAGYGWGHAQRPDPSGCHLRFYSSTSNAKNICIRNNIFCGAKGPAFFAPSWSKAQIDALAMDHNCWHQPEGVMIEIANAAYTMADFSRYQADWSKEPHSLCAEPRFIDMTQHDFRLAPDSPCVGLGAAEMEP